MKGVNHYEVIWSGSLPNWHFFKCIYVCMLNLSNARMVTAFQNRATAIHYFFSQDSNQTLVTLLV